MLKIYILLNLIGDLNVKSRYLIELNWRLKC